MPARKPAFASFSVAFEWPAETTIPAAASLLMTSVPVISGASVTLVAGPVHLPTPRGVRRINVQSAQNMLDAVLAQVEGADIFIATAAVADWRPAHSAEQKIKKDGSGQVPQLAFVENPDILATVAQLPQAKSGALYCVGFAAESENLLAGELILAPFFTAASRRMASLLPLRAVSFPAAS